MNREFGSDEGDGQAEASPHPGDVPELRDPFGPTRRIIPEEPAPRPTSFDAGELEPDSFSPPAPEAGIPHTPARDATREAPAAPAHPEPPRAAPGHPPGPPAPPKGVAAAPPGPNRAAGPPPKNVGFEVQAQLPNATVGKPYDASVTLALRARGAPQEQLDGVSVHCYEVHGLEDLGLGFEAAPGGIRVAGEPRTAGDHPLTIVYSLLKAGEVKAVGRKAVTLTINPDPRSLWKEVEPDPGLPYRKEHTDRARVVGGSVLLAASRRGRSHAQKGEFRDDDFRVEHVPDHDWYVLAVADGAGASRFSRQGALLACDAACEKVRPHLSDTLGDPFRDHLADYARTRGDGARRQIRGALYKSLGGAAHAAFRRVEKEAAERSAPIKEFATTLIVAICRRFDFGWFVGAFAVGDGGIAIYRREGEVVVLNRPDSGDFAGQTRFLTMPEIWADGEAILGRIHFEVVPELTAVVAMTDGVSDPKFQAEKDFFEAARWHELWDDLSAGVRLEKGNAEADAQLLEWLSFWSTGNHDDRTIALLLP
jgi:hypothetical protein